MTKEPGLYLSEPVESVITTVRGQKVILDSNLARIYGVPTKRLNEQVRRNSSRFPSDFVFRLSLEETANPRSTTTTGSDNAQLRSRSQFATLKRGQNIKYLPYAFTEHGAIMAANVLNSPRAVQMSVFIVRAFVKMREQLISRADLEKRLLQVENVLLTHDDQIRDVYEKIRPLLLPEYEAASPPVTGFKVKESRTKYTVKRRK